MQPSADAPQEATSPVDAHWTVGEQLARQFQLHSQDMQQTLDTIVKSATDIVEPAHYGGLITVTRGRMTPQATRGEPPYVLDVLQQQTGDGPCLAAAASQQLVCIDDTEDERRWAEFTTRAVELGVRSVICVPLWVSDDVLGTLSLYSRLERAFGPYVQVAELVAAHAALALATATLVQQLRGAFVNRDVIGQAKGILMERHRISADDAFRRLSAASQATNRKVFEICASLAETGVLPDASAHLR